MARAQKLTPKQARFVDEYLIDLNSTAAAVRAGYSPRTANKIGPELLGKTSIQKVIAQRMADREKRTEITQDMVLRELAKIAFIDPRKFFDASGKLIPVHLLDCDTAACIAGMDISVIAGEADTVETTKKIKQADKLAALGMVGKHLGMFSQKVELSIKEKLTPEQRRAKIAELQAKQAASKK